jgi:hypothetical protein
MLVSPFKSGKLCGNGAVPSSLELESRIAYGEIDLKILSCAA